MNGQRLSDHALERSDVVANCRMNRERELAGSNGYDLELGLHPLRFLQERISSGRPVRWLDLCCGTGRALRQAAEQLEQAGVADAVAIVGVDLVEVFWPGREHPCLRLLVESVHRFAPADRFDLISCVHGLHYLGDKLRVIARAVSWLTEDGLLVANLDLANLRRENGEPLARRILPHFRAAGIVHDSRRKRLSCEGRREVSLPLVYLGADDEAGPNCSGQPAVNSYYREM